MSDDEKLIHYEMIRKIVKDELKPINRNQNIFISIAIGCFGFMFLTQMSLTKEVQAKADKIETERDYVRKLDYYQIEEDEHRMMLELAPDINKATNVYNRINDNISASLGFKYTTRGK